jgi:hypothetical protein
MLGNSSFVMANTLGDIGTYDYDFCVLFLYHKCDELTKFHLESLRCSNPSAFVLPLTDSAEELLPGSVDVAKLPPSCRADAQKWRGIDATLYRWFENRGFNARRYLVAEYDCLCNINLADYYAEVWDADVAGIDFFTRQNNPHWYWFVRELYTIPYEDRLHAAGIVPFTCTMFSHAALEKIVGSVYTHDIFCELRLGTTVNKLGLKFQKLPRRKRSTICWHEYPWQTNRPGFFHAVKSLEQKPGKRPQPGDISARVYDFLRSLTHNREFLPFFLWRRRQCWPYEPFIRLGRMIRRSLRLTSK